MSKKSTLRTKVLPLALSIALLGTTPGLAVAAVDGYVTQSADSKTYTYSFDDLKASLNAYLVDETSTAGALWKHFVDKKTSIMALHDDVKGYVSFASVRDALLAAVVAGTPFDVDEFTESGDATPATLPDVITEVTPGPEGVITTDVPSDEAYAALKAGIDAKVAAYKALADGDLSTQALVDAAKASKALVDLTGLKDADKTAAQAILTAADAKVTAAEAALVGLKVSSVTAINATTLDVTVVGDLVNKVIDVNDFTVTIAGSAVVPTVTAGATAGHYTLTLATALTNTQVAVVTGKGDLSGNASVTYKTAGLASATSKSNLSVEVVLNQAVATINKSDFAISNLVVQSASLAADGKTVTLTTTSQSGTVTYTVTYQGSTTTFVGTPAPAFGIESINVKNTTQIEVKLSRQVSTAVNTGAIDPTNYTLHNLDNSVLFPLTGLSTCTLLADRQTVLIDITGNLAGMAAVRASGATGLLPGTNNYVLYVDQDGTNTVQDLDRNVMTANTNKSFSGKSDLDVTGPEVQSAVFNTSGKTLVVSFNEPVATLTNLVDYTKITAKAGTKSYTLNIDDVRSVLNNQVGFNLSAAAVTALTDIAAVGSPKLELAAGAVQDRVQPVRNQNVAVTVDLTVQVTPVLNSATYNREANKLSLVFDKTIDLTKFTNMAGITIKGSFGNVTLNAGTGDKVLTTTNSNTIEIQLSAANAATYEGITSVAPTATKVSLLAGTFTATDASQNLLISDQALTYTNDVTAPTIVSTTFDVGNNELKLVFSEAIRVSSISDNVAFINLGYSTNGSTSIALTAGGGVNQATINVAKTTLTDLTNTVYLTVAGATARAALTPGTAFITGSGTGNAAIVDTNYLPMVQIQAGDRKPVSVLNAAGPRVLGSASWGRNVIRVAFDSDMDKTTAENPANYEVYLAGNQSASRRVTEAQMLNDKRTVFLTVENMDVSAGYSVKVTAAKDAQGSVIDVTNDRNLTSFNTPAVHVYTDPATVAQTTPIVDSDSSASLNAGDVVKVFYNQPINIIGNISTASFTVSGAHTFGTGALFYKGVNANEVNIRLGAGATLLPNDTITSAVPGTAEIASYWSTATVAAVGAAVTQTPPETVAPYVTAGVYSDVNANGRVDKGDTLTVTYDSTITQKLSTTLRSAVAAVVNLGGAAGTADEVAALAAVTNEFALAGGTNIGGNDTTFAAGADGKSIVITLGTDADLDAAGATGIVSGATVDAGAAPTITDGWNNAAVTRATALVGGTPVSVSFSSTQTEGRPYVVSAKYFDNGAAAVSDGDTIEVKFSEPVSAAGLANTDFATFNGTALVGTGATFRQTASDTITINLGTGGAGVAYTVGAAAGSVAIDNSFDIVGAPTLAKITDLQGNQAVRTTSGVKLASGILDADTPKVASAVAWTTVVTNAQGADSTSLGAGTANADLVTTLTQGGGLTIAPAVNDIITVRALKNGVQVQTTVNVTATTTVANVNSAIAGMLGLEAGAVTAAGGNFVIDGAYAGAHVVVENFSMTLQTGATNKAAFDEVFATQGGPGLTYAGTVRVTATEAVIIAGASPSNTVVRDINIATVGEVFSGADAVTTSDQLFNKTLDASLTTWYPVGAIGNATDAAKAKMALLAGAPVTDLAKNQAAAAAAAPDANSSVSVTYQQ